MIVNVDYVIILKLWIICSSRVVARYIWGVASCATRMQVIPGSTDGISKRIMKFDGFEKQCFSVGVAYVMWSIWKAIMQHVLIMLTVDPVVIIYHVSHWMTYCVDVQRVNKGQLICGTTHPL